MEKSKCQLAGSVTKVTHSVTNIHLLQTAVIKYLQPVWAWSFLASLSSGDLCSEVYQAMYKSLSYLTSMAYLCIQPVKSWRVVWPCKVLVLCNQYMWPPIVLHPLNSQKHLLSIVSPLYFFPFSLFLAILSTSSLPPQKPVAESHCPLRGDGHCY